MARRNRVTPRGRPSSAPFKRSDGKVTNRYGVTVTEGQLRELRLSARAANENLKRRNTKIKAAMKANLPKGVTPVIDTYSVYAPKSGSFNQFKTKQAFNAYVRRLQYLYNRRTGESEAYSRRVAANYNNFITAIEKTLGELSDTPAYQRVMTATHKLGPERLLDALDSYAVSDVGYVYYSRDAGVDKLRLIEMELYDYANNIGGF